MNFTLAMPLLARLTNVSVQSLGPNLISAVSATFLVDALLWLGLLTAVHSSRGWKEDVAKSLVVVAFATLAFDEYS